MGEPVGCAIQRIIRQLVMCSFYGSALSPAPNLMLKTRRDRLLDLFRLEA